jgi:hypothetical protein
VARNPSLGALIKSFKNGNLPGQESEDATWEADSSGLIDSIAQNMRNISRADFTANLLAAKVVTNVPFYQNLHHLTVNGFEFDQIMWNNFPTTLRSLEWETPPHRSSNENNWHPWGKAQFLINVVESTCPDLEYLNISIAFSNWRSRPGPELQSVASHIIEQYQGNGASSPQLANLHHFGFTYSKYGEDVTQHDYINFINKYQHSLNSVSIPLGNWSRKDTLEFASGVCTLLPNLKNLALTQNAYHSVRADISGQNYFPAFVKSLSSPRFSIEKLSIDDIGTSFSSIQGQLFHGLTKLRVLRVGDAENTDGPYGDEGRINVADYRDVSFLKVMKPI